MKRCATVVALLLVTACATTDDGAYPSLSPRAAERVGFEEPAVAPPAPVVADPALDARLADAGARLDTITRGFAADAGRAARAAATSGARTVGSEAWIEAQTALAALDDWRAQASSLASDLEAMAGERAGTVGTPYPTLDALRARAATEAAREAATIVTLSAKLPTP